MGEWGRGAGHPAVQELDRLNRALTEAYEREDVAWLQDRLSAAHVHNNVFGSRLDRDTFLRDIQNGTLEFLSYTTPTIDWWVRDDVAVATGVIRAVAKRDGRRVPAEYFRFTRLFVRENGEWRVLLFHNTMLKEAPPAGG